MSTALAIKFAAETMRSLAFGSIGAAYAGVGSSFTHPIRMLYVINTTNVILLFSFDGITDHFPVVSAGYIMLDIASNKSSNGLYLPEGSRVYVKQGAAGAPASGTVYLSSFYGSVI